MHHLEALSFFSSIVLKCPIPEDLFFLIISGISKTGVGGFSDLLGTASSTAIFSVYWTIRSYFSKPLPPIEGLQGRLKIYNIRFTLRAAIAVVKIISLQVSSPQSS
jgi:hypothetical protein